MAIQLDALLKQRGTGARDETPRASRHVIVEAESYEAAQDLVRADLPDGWIVASLRIIR